MSDKILPIGMKKRVRKPRKMTPEEKEKLDKTIDKLKGHAPDDMPERTPEQEEKARAFFRKASQNFKKRIQIERAKKARKRLRKQSLIC